MGTTTMGTAAKTALNWMPSSLAQTVDWMGTLHRKIFLIFWKIFLSFSAGIVPHKSPSICGCANPSRTRSRMCIWAVIRGKALRSRDNTTVVCDWQFSWGHFISICSWQERVPVPPEQWEALMSEQMAKWLQLTQNGFYECLVIFTLIFIVLHILHYYLLTLLYYFTFCYFWKKDKERIFENILLFGTRQLKWPKIGRQVNRQFPRLWQWHKSKADSFDLTNELFTGKANAIQCHPCAIEWRQSTAAKTKDWEETKNKGIPVMFGQ